MQFSFCDYFNSIHFDDPYNLVLCDADFIRNLIERKQVMDAIGFICTFNLADKIPVIPLLKQYVEDAKKCSEVTWSLKELHEEKVPWLFFRYFISVSYTVKSKTILNVNIHLFTGYF